MSVHTAMLAHMHECISEGHCTSMRVLPHVPNPSSDAWSAAAADTLLSLTATPAVRKREMGKGWGWWSVGGGWGRRAVALYRPCSRKP